MELNAKTKEAYEFIKANSTKNENGSYTVKQSDYLKFMDGQGVTKQILESVRDNNTAWNNGMYLKAADALKENIEAAKKAGEDATKATGVVTTNVYNGQIKMKLQASKTFPNPSKPGVSVVKTAVGGLTIEQNRCLDQSILTETEEDIKKLLGL